MIDKNKTLIDLDDKTPRILKVDGTEVPFPPKDGKAYDYREIQKAISGDGNNDPCFTMANDMEGMQMLAEDNAIAMGLPVNVKATWFYNEAAMRKGHPNPFWRIRGNCLLVPMEMMK